MQALRECFNVFPLNFEFLIICQKILNCETIQAIFSRPISFHEESSRQGETNSPCLLTTRGGAEVVSFLGKAQLLQGVRQPGQARLLDRHAPSEYHGDSYHGACLEQYHPGHPYPLETNEGVRGLLGSRYRPRGGRNPKT